MKVKYILSLIILIIILIPIGYIGPYYFSVQQFHADPEKGYHADFFLYISPKAKKQAKRGEPITLLIQPNNSGNSDDPEFHSKDAWWMCFGRHKLANELGVALLVPAFIRPSTDWHIYSHALDRDVLTTERVDLKRIDLQLVSMVDHTKEQWRSIGWKTNEKFLIQGFSASGMFANRFATLHPDKILGVAAGSPGGWPIVPLDSFNNKALNYPAGLGDFELLTGNAFDSLSYTDMPQLIVMGALDENDSLDFTDGWEKENAELIESLFGSNPVARWDEVKRIYAEANANAEFKLVEGIGHDRKALQYLSTEFFKRILRGEE